MRSIRISLLLVFVFFTTLLNAQNGFIRGTVFDDGNGETLPGVTIVVEATTTGTITDFDGNFNLSLEPGNYNLRVSFVSYETIIINDIEVKEKEVYLLENIRLKGAELELTEVIVTAQEVRNTESALNTIKMKSANLLDGISASSLRKIGDSDAASSMKRVTGVSVEGGKYVYVRGLGDRYTKTTLNGLDIPGLDPDRNTLQMDIFPNNIIDNLIVHKSFSAELPADFTGGVIDIEIEDFPDQKKGNISLGLGYNPYFHLNDDYLTYKGGKTDYLGFDDGTRAIPAKDNIPDFTQAISNPTGQNGTRYKEVLESFNPTMAAMKEKSFMDYNFGFTFGNQHPLKRVTLGYNFAFSYKNNTEFYENAEYGRYGLTGQDVYEMQRRDYTIGDYGVSNVFLSGLAGFAIKTKNSKFRIYLLHLQNSESKAGVFDYNASDLGTTFDAFQHTLDFSQRSISNVLLDGRHVFQDGKWNVEWKFSPTISKIIDPDIRFTRYVIRDDGSLNIGTESGFPERVWRDLEETNLSGVLHLTKEFNFNNQKAKLKFGGAYTYKERDFSIQSFAINIRSWDDPLTGDPNELFLAENLWPRLGNIAEGVTYDASFFPTNRKKFYANVNYFAGYASIEMTIFKNMKTVLGGRYESYVQNYSGANQTGSIILENEKVLDNNKFFPSVNIIYSLTEKQNLRFSYSQTIARPSFKELSYSEIYDPISGRTFIGGLFEDRDDVLGVTYWNGKLVSTDIQNFDFRWELFQTGGQSISVSGFYKSFDRPIELVQYATTQKTSIQPRNVGDGKVFGAEIEVRQGLGLLSEKFSSFYIIANFTYAKSQIKMSQTEYESRVNSARNGETIDEYRDMAGQAPYIVNAGISYNGGSNGFWNGFEAGFYYNMQGQTLQIVGISDRPNVYTQPFHSLNFNSNKSFGKDRRIQIGFKVENLLNDNKESIYKSYNATDQYYTKLSQGTTFQIKFGYNFF